MITYSQQTCFYYLHAALLEKICSPEGKLNTGSWLEDKYSTTFADTPNTVQINALKKITCAQLMSF
jgi:hypothetical protein